MGAAIIFFVPGLPAPQGSKRAVRFPNGHVGMIESSKRVKPWRNDVAAAAMEARARQHWPTTLYGFSVKIAALVFAMPRPGSHLRKAGELAKGAPATPRGKPDVDKLERAVLDALTGILWQDDSQVVSICEAHKVFTRDTPGVFVRLETLGPEPELSFAVRELVGEFGFRVGVVDLERRDAPPQQRAPEAQATQASLFASDRGGGSR